MIERKLTDVLREVSHLQPLGERSDTLHEPASRDGIYAAPNLVEAHRDQLDDPALRTRITEAVQGTGIVGPIPSTFFDTTGAAGDIVEISLKNRSA